MPASRRVGRGRGGAGTAPQSRARGFPLRNEGSRRALHPDPARSWEMKINGAKILWEEGRGVGSHTRRRAGGQGGHVHSRAGTSPETVTAARGAPARRSVSPSQDRRHHLLLLLSAYSCASHRGRRLLAGGSHRRRPRATSAYVSPRACAVAPPRPLGGLGPRGGRGRGAVSSRACSVLSERRRERAGPGGARAAFRARERGAPIRSSVLIQRSALACCGAGSLCSLPGCCGWRCPCLAPP